MDEVLDHVIGKGKYQLIVIILLTSVALPASFMQTASVFLAALPEHHCAAVIDNINSTPCFTDDEWKKVLPWNDGKQRTHSCRQFNYNLSTCSLQEDCSNCVHEVINATSSKKLVPCQNGYHYSNKTFEETIATEWNLVCDRLTLKSLSTSIFYLGVLVGSGVGGFLADRFGRTTVFKVGCTIAFLCGIAMSFSPNLYVFALLRFLVAFFFKGAALSAIVLSSEICKKSWRTTVLLLYNIIYGIGCLVMGGVASLFTRWRPLEIALASAFLPMIVTGFIVPQSPRWLIAIGKSSKAKKVLYKMTKRNNSGISKEEIDELKFLANEEVRVKTENTLKESFLRPYTRMVTIGNMFVWMVTSMVYYGLSLNSSALAGNIYVNHALGGIMEFFASVGSLFFIKKIGCRNWTVSTLLLASVTCLSSTLTMYVWPNSDAAGKVGVVLAMLGRFSSSATFAVLYVHTAEMFPTSGRTTAIGLGSTAARVGSIFSPLTLQVQYHTPWLTQTIFGCSALIAAIISSTFPETLGENLMMDFEQTEKFFATRIRRNYLTRCFCSSTNGTSKKN